MPSRRFLIAARLPTLPLETHRIFGTLFARTLSYFRPSCVRDANASHYFLSSKLTCKGPAYSNQYLTSSGGVSSNSFFLAAKSLKRPSM